MLSRSTPWLLPFVPPFRTLKCTQVLTAKRWTKASPDRTFAGNKAALVMVPVCRNMSADDTQRHAKLAVILQSPAAPKATLRRTPILTGPETIGDAPQIPKKQETDVLSDAQCLYKATAA